MRGSWVDREVAIRSFGSAPECAESGKVCFLERTELIILPQWFVALTHEVNDTREPCDES